MGPEGGIAVRWVPEGRENVCVGGWGEVEVPVGCSDDLVGGWVECFDAAVGWVAGYGVDEVAHSDGYEFYIGVGLGGWIGAVAVAVAVAASVGLGVARGAEHNV